MAGVDGSSTSLLFNPRHTQKAGRQPVSEQRDKPGLSGALFSQAGTWVPLPAMEDTQGHVGTKMDLAGSDLEFNPTYHPGHRSALTHKPEISPGACRRLPTPLSYSQSVTRRPAHLLPPGPWAAGTPCRVLRQPRTHGSSHRGHEAGVAAHHCPPPCACFHFLSHHWTRT